MTRLQKRLTVDLYSYDKSPRLSCTCKFDTFGKTVP